MPQLGKVCVVKIAQLSFLSDGRVLERKETALSRSLLEQENGKKRYQLIDLQISLFSCIIIIKSQRNAMARGKATGRRGRAVENGLAEKPEKEKTACQRLRMERRKRNPRAASMTWQGKGDFGE